MRILVNTNISKPLVDFRGDLIRELRQRGHIVVACASDVHKESLRQLNEWEVQYISVDLNRRALNIRADVQYLNRLREIVRRVRPNLVFCFTAKPVVYGSLAAWIEGVPRIVSMIPGAGAAAVSLPGLRPKLVSKVVRTLYRLTLRLNEKVIFLNNDDRELFVGHHLVSENQVIQIPSEGVNMERFPISPPIMNPVRFLLIARLLPDKGIREYAAACKQLKDAGLSFEAHLIGPLEQGGATISKAEVRGWETQGILKWGGEVQDVWPHLAKSSVYVLPSYREGVPRSTLEAMSMGRPIITTDSVGCRETVREGVNGFLVPVRDAERLAQAMRRFIEHPELIQTMGAASRAFAEECFDVHKVNATILRELGL